MAKKFVLFDFDGVIIDSFGLALETTQVGTPGISAEEYRTCFEGNINETSPDADGRRQECAPGFDFFQIYVPKILAEAPLFSGIAEAIRALSDKYSLAIVSSTITAPIRTILERHGLADGFVEVLGNDVDKSKVNKIEKIFAQYGIGANDCVFVTDTLGDMREASKAGVGSIAVSWGFHDRARLEKGNPFKIVDAPTDLMQAVEDYFKR